MVAMEFNSGGNCFLDMALPQSSDALPQETKPAVGLGLEPGVERGDYVKTQGSGGFCSLNNRGGNSICEESLSYLNQGEDTELDVDVLGCSDNASEQVLGDDPDATEYSSSFGNTFSGSDERLDRDTSDVEVDSPFYGQNGSSAALNCLCRVFRKKKLTTHWQKYVCPLRWRCNWLELRMKELHSQALKYEKELSAYNQEKSLLLNTLASARSVSRTMPFMCSQGKYAMKRKPRKRIEDRVDVLSYMSCHNIFSYYVVSVDQNAECHDGLATNHDWPMLDFIDGDNSLEHLLLEIETIQSRVVKLRTQLNKTVERKDTRGSDSSIIQRELVSISVQSPTPFPGCNGDAPPIGAPNTPSNYLSECETEELVVSDNAVSSFGDAAPNVIKSTVSLLSVDQNQVGNAHDDIVDDILMNNPAVKEELWNFEKVSHALEKPQESLKDEDGSTAPKVPVSETGSEIERTVSGEKVLRCCSSTVTNVRRSKRRLAERRLSPSRWHCEKIGKRRYSKSREHS